MYKKDTELLFNELRNAESPSRFIKQNAEEMKQVSVSDFLIDMLIKYKLEKNEVILKAHMTASYAYQIFDGRKKAGRDKLIQLSMGFPLELAEINGLLRCGGYNELYVRSKRDALIMFAISKQYDVFALNELLSENGEEPMC